MKRHLFLTGPIGCGKSTILWQALGVSHLHRAGGFLTVRRRNVDGKPANFVLMDPAGAEKQIFLDLTAGKPVVNLDVFSRFGTALLNRAEAYPYIILDEIGGMELLCPEFLEALDRLLSSDIPILGVLKGEGPASVMISRLGLAEEYEEAAASLRNRLAQDPNTAICHVDQYGPKAALALTERWVKEYLHD